MHFKKKLGKNTENGQFNRNQILKCMFSFCVELLSFANSIQFSRENTLTMYWFFTHFDIVLCLRLIIGIWLFNDLQCTWLDSLCYPFYLHLHLSIEMELQWNSNATQYIGLDLLADANRCECHHWIRRCHLSYSRLVSWVMALHTCNMHKYILYANSMKKKKK